MTKQIDTNWHYPEKGEYPVAFGEYKHKVYPQIPCLVLYKGRYCVRYWNCIEECWDQEDGDDFFCLKDSVKEWMYIDALEQKRPGTDVEKEIEKEIDRFWCSLFTDFTMERNPNHSPVFIPNPKYTKEGYRIAYALDIDWKDRNDFDGLAFGSEFLRSAACHFAEWGAIYLNTRKED